MPGSNDAPKRPLSQNGDHDQPNKRRKLSEPRTTPESRSTPKQESDSPNSSGYPPRDSITVSPNTSISTDLTISTDAEDIDPDMGELLAARRFAKSVPFPVGGPPATLEMRLKVHKDGAEYQTRTLWHGDLYVHLRQGEFNIGHIKGWLLRKSDSELSETRPNRPLWVNEWLQGPMSKYKKKGPAADMALALRSLYAKTGKPMKEEVTEYISEDFLVFIEMIHIKDKDDETGIKFAGNKLLKHVFQMYYACFADPRIPEEFRPKGAYTPFILEPGLPVEDDIARGHWPGGVKPKEKSRGAEEMREAAVQKLKSIYTSASIGYQMLADAALVEKSRGSYIEHTVLARKVDVKAAALQLALDGGAQDTQSV